MRKVMTIVGTRPELIKMSRVISLFDQHTNHILVHTGQNHAYELNQVFFDDLGIRKPNHFLEVADSNSTAAQTIGKIIERSDLILEQEQPDAVLIYGDTNSCLSVICAKRRKIPVFHMEAGNRCFDQRVPEELNRKIVDHLSDINLVLTEHARRYLIAEGLPPEQIIKTGSHMQEVLDHYMPSVIKSDILTKLNIQEGKYFLISAHREENVDVGEILKNFVESLHELVKTYDMPIIVSTHPRTALRLEKMGMDNIHEKIKFLKPFGFNDYMKLQMSAFCILSDSGTITEEASLLNLPAITIRNAHERPEGMDEGTLIMSSMEPQKIMDAVKVITSNYNREKRTHQIAPDYQTSVVSRKILNIVLSYIDYVNRVIWYK